jgi:hypothetical protein
MQEPQGAGSVEIIRDDIPQIASFVVARPEIEGRVQNPERGRIGDSSRRERQIPVVNTGRELSA